MPQGEPLPLNGDCSRWVQTLIHSRKEAVVVGAEGLGLLALALNKTRSPALCPMGCTTPPLSSHLAGWPRASTTNPI